MKFQTVVFIMLLGLAGYSSVGYSEESGSYQADAIASGKYADAEQGLLTILENNPDDPYALLNLAYVYQKSGDATKAQQVWPSVHLRRCPLTQRWCCSVRQKLRPAGASCAVLESSASTSSLTIRKM